jgi:hypothetical protein
MTKPSIFIGSSSEALDFPRAVQEQLSSDAEVTIWNELPFVPGQFTIETLLNIRTAAKKCQRETPFGFAWPYDGRI